MKYIVLVKIDEPELWSKCRPGLSAKHFKSPFMESKEEAKRWSESFLKKYRSNARINEKSCDKKYFIKYGILAIDENDSFGLEFLEDFVIWKVELYQARHV